MNTAEKLEDIVSPVVKNPITVMSRYELKYLLNPIQKLFFLKKIRTHMKADEFGRTSIASLYYDTPDHRLIRASLERPAFKEKIRLRSYGLATDTTPVYLELKRKAEGIVYKRRVPGVLPEVKRFFAGESDVFAGGQVGREITAFRDFYRTLVPSCLIIYDRTAYFEPEGDLRLTIDENPRYRTDYLNLTKSMEGISLLPEGWCILEVKVQQAMPLWLSAILDEGKIYKTSFSKYGEAYRRQLMHVQ